MEIFRKLEYNYVLICAASSWAVAQIIKTILFWVLNKQFNSERLFGAGGMPSSHSALVCSATVATARSVGVGSTEFAIMFIIAMVVMYDAMGVRRAAGMHAKEINKMHRILKEKGAEPVEDNTDSRKKKELKEFLGHTPLEVLAGAMLGILMALFIPVSI